MEEPTGETPTEGQKLGALPPDINAFTPEERIDYIMAIRRRVDEDDTKVSDDEIRNAVCLIRLTRADVAKTRRSKKAPETTFKLSDF